MKPKSDIEQFEFDNDTVLTRTDGKVSKIVQTGKLGGMVKTTDISRDVDGNVSNVTTTVD